MGKGCVRKAACVDNPQISFMESLFDPFLAAIPGHQLLARVVKDKQR